MRLHVLGAFEVDGTTRTLPPRERAVVSALAVRLGQRVDPEELADALWGEHPPSTSAKQIQASISRLRQGLGGQTIETTSGGYRLRPEEVWLDSRDFEALVERARGHAANRSPERAIAAYEQALALWRGPAYDVLGEWLPARLEAIRLDELRLSAEEELLRARLDAGDHRGAAAAGVVLAREQPYRERRWTLLALAQYRSERQADALKSIRTAKRLLGQELGLDAGSEMLALESAILAQDPALAAAPEARLAHDDCPWKGLVSYGPEDHDTFFGRDDDIEGCLGRLGRSPLLVVTGPSGCGKSSLVHAGLVPDIRRGGRQVEVLTPGPDGAAAMAAALAHSPDPVLVIDQFEEAFTTGTDTAGREVWLADIANYATTIAPVVLVVRSDHVAGLSDNAELARLAEEGLHLVTALSPRGLREVIQRPAEEAGLRMEPGLVELLLRDAEGQSGALPLLSHALTETWRRRDSGTLTVEGYREAGGIHDAVATSAERLYAGLTAREQDALRWLMLRLVSLSETGEPFRTRLPHSVADDPARRRLLDLLVRSRLVTAHTTHYEVAHEALVRGWPRLHAWLEEDAAGQRIRRHLAGAAADWESGGRDAGELYRGARLEGLLEWLDLEREPLTDAERAFIDASQSAAQDELRSLAVEARRQRVQNRRLRVLVAGALALLLLAVLATGLAVRRGGEAARNRDAATSAADTARHEALVARSAAVGSTNRAVGALLAIEAWRERPNAAALAALLESVTRASGFLGYRFLTLAGQVTWPAPGPFPGAGIAAIPGSGHVLISIGSTVARVDPATGDTVAGPFGRSVAEGGGESLVRVSRDGSRAAHLQTGRGTGCAAGFDPSPTACTLLVVHDLLTGQSVFGPVVTPFDASDVALSNDGDLVAVAGGADGELATWDVETGRQLGRLPGASRQENAAETDLTGAVAFGPRDRVFVGSLAGPVREVAARTLRVRRVLDGAPLGSNRRLVVTPTGRLVASGDGAVAVWSLQTGRRLWMATGSGKAERCSVLAVSAELDRAYCSGESGRIVERDLATGQPTGVVRDFQSGAGDLALTDGGVLVAVTPTLIDSRGVIARWRLDGPGVEGRLLAPDVASTGGYDPSGRFVLVAGERSAARVLDADGRLVTTLGADVAATWLSSETIALVGRTSRLVDLSSGNVRSASALGPDTFAVYPEPSGTHAWATSRRGDRWTVQRFEVATGRPTGDGIVVPEASAVKAVSDGRVVLITVTEQSGARSSAFDARSGGSLSGGSAEFGAVTGMFDQLLVAITPDGAYLGADYAGFVAEYADYYSSEPRATYPGSRPGASSLQLNEDGSRLLVTSPGQTLQLYDTATRTPLGDALISDSPDGVVEGWLRPDGDKVLVNTRDGVVEVDLDPDRLVDAACHLAGRDLNRVEWSTYVGEDVDYRSLCPDYGLPPIPGA